MQRDLLTRYLRDNADTEFGRAHRFSSIATVDDFRERLPLTEYDDYVPYIDSIRAGRQNVLTADPVLCLMPSSGSTGARKLLPYTTNLQREFNAAVSPWIVDLYTRHPQLLGGRAYWSISPIAEDCCDANSAIPIGFEDDSAYLGGFAKRLVDSVLAVPNGIRHIRDIDSFRYTTLLLLLCCGDLRLISVWHPSFLMLL